MLKSYSSAPFLAGLLHLLLPEAQAGIRTGVSINGTTVGPNYTRAEGKRDRMHTISNKKYQPSHHSFHLVMTKCPDSHPYPLGGGLQCCKVSLKLNDSSLNSDCDGGRVKVDSSPECCIEGMMQPCSDQEEGCNLAKSEYIPVFKH